MYYRVVFLYSEGKEVRSIESVVCVKLLCIFFREVESREEFIKEIRSG